MESTNPNDGILIEIKLSSLHEISFVSSQLHAKIIESYNLAKRVKKRVIFAIVIITKVDCNEINCISIIVNGHILPQLSSVVTRRCSPSDYYEVQLPEGTQQTC